MNPKSLGSFFLQDSKGFKELVLGHAKLSLPRIVHNVCPQFKNASRIITTRDDFWNTCCSLQMFNIFKGIQVNGRTQFTCIGVFLVWRVVGREHNLRTQKVQFMAHQKLYITRAVHTTTFFLENFQNSWSWSSLNCKIFLKALVPRKGLVDGSCLLTNPLLIIQVKGSRELGNNRF
ncbi:Uncharacterised protein [Streptococcus pneumoniae]|nr:Uncharacterised protein [Streptococcus pneumoniae]